MSDEHHVAIPHDPAAIGRVNPVRLTAFSDGIFAIAATLLIIDIRVPGSNERVWSALADEWPALVSYVISFLVIGIAWIHHHNLFHHVRHVDRTVLFLNLGMLVTIGFLPLPTAVLGTHLAGSESVPAAVFYAGSLAAVSLWFTLLWNHLYGQPHLVQPDLLDQVRQARRRAVLGPLSYLMAAGLALLSPVGSLGLIAAIVLYYIFGRQSPAARTRWLGPPSPAAARTAESSELHP